MTFATPTRAGSDAVKSWSILLSEPASAAGRARGADRDPSFVGRTPSSRPFGSTARHLSAETTVGPVAQPLGYPAQGEGTVLRPPPRLIAERSEAVADTALHQTPTQTGVTFELAPKAIGKRAPNRTLNLSPDATDNWRVQGRGRCTFVLGCTVKRFPHA